MIPKDIRQIPLLAEINPDVLARHCAQGGVRVRQYTKGTTVHQQHERCTALDVVLSGSLAAYSLSENGSVMSMFSFQKNSMIGANLLFGDQNAYPLNIYSVTPCKLLHISLHAVTEFLRDYQFVMRYVKALSMNSQGMNQKIVMMAHKTLRENLLDYMKRQSIAQGSATFTLSVSKKQLADTLGVQRPSLFRELKKLKDENVIAVDNRVITLYRP